MKNAARVKSGIVLVLSALVLSMLAVAAPADPTVQVTFPEKGGYVYWVEHKDATGKLEISTPKRVAGEGAAIDLAFAATNGKLSTGLLKVYDPKAGNLTAKKLENLAGKKELKLKTADFDLVRKVQIVLKPAESAPDERVESAVVKLKDANSDEFTAVVDPSSQGIAEFHDVAGGQEAITVSYTGGSMTVDLEAPLDRDDPVFTHTLAISAKVPTVRVSTGAPTEAGNKEGAASSGTKEKSRPAASLLPAYILGFVFLAMVLAIILVIMKTKGATFKGGLEKMGVTFPDADAGAAPGAATSAAAGPPVDPNVCQFCGQRKDANGNCACTVTAPSAVPSSTTGVARLIGTQGPYAGRIFEMTGGELTIGRDEANAVPLSDDHTTSRRHARLTKENGSVTIMDEGSSNGTFVNGAKIASKQALSPGDEVQIGSTKFRFEL